MSDGMGREFAYLSSHATNRYFIPNWGIDITKCLHISENSLVLVLQKTHIKSLYRHIKLTLSSSQG